MPSSSEASSCASAAPTTRRPTGCTTSWASPATWAARRSPASTSRSTRSTTARSARPAAGCSRTAGSRVSCADRVAHPDVGLDVAPHALPAVDLDRHERALDDVAAAVRKGHARPLLPLGDGALDEERAGTDAEDLGAEPLVDAEPRIEKLPVGAAPAQVALHRRQRVARLERRTHRSDERVE